jgi:hypothetical protein
MDQFDLSPDEIRRLGRSAAAAMAVEAARAAKERP